MNAQLWDQVTTQCVIDELSRADLGTSWVARHWLGGWWAGVEVPPDRCLRVGREGGMSSQARTLSWGGLARIAAKKWLD